MFEGGSLAEGANVFRALGMYMVQGLTLEASYNGGGSWGFRSVGDDGGIVAGSGLHNHLQFSGECNTSKAHSRSTLSDRPSPASLSWRSIAMISFPEERGGEAPKQWGKGLVL